jgi:hypothetical protein
MRLAQVDLVMVVAALTLVLWTSAAGAQPWYAAGSLGADIGRTGSADGSDAPGTGEALSFSLRVGTGLTSRFGVELDFTRPSEIETDETPDVRILLPTPYTITPDLSLLSPGDLNRASLPISVIGYTIHTAQRTTTITAAAWARQEVTPRVSLVYLGGVAFGRVERTVTTSFDVPPLLASIYRPTYDLRTIDYSVGPMAGFEGRVGFTEHVQVIPGIRVLSVGGGWILRPAVSLSWVF